MNTTDLDTATLAALRTYAAAHGRAWKAALRTDWMHARTGVPELQALRNTHGPRWLATFRLQG